MAPSGQGGGGAPLGFNRPIVDINETTELFRHCILKEPKQHTSVSETIATSSKPVPSGKPPHVLYKAGKTDVPARTVTDHNSKTTTNSPGYSPGGLPVTQDHAVSPAQTIHSQEVALKRQSQPAASAIRPGQRFVSVGEAKTGMHPALVAAIGNKYQIAVPMQPLRDQTNRARPTTTATTTAAATATSTPVPPTQHSAPVSSEPAEVQWNAPENGWGEPDKGWDVPDEILPKARLTQNALRAGQKWRPRKSEDWESQSLPETISSCINSDTGARDQAANVNKSGDNDIRAEIGRDKTLKTRQGQLVMDDWQYDGADSDEDAAFGVSYIQPFVRAWVKDVPAKIETHFLGLSPDHHLCDVDTSSGELLAPIQQPPTTRNDDPSMPEKMRFRQLNMTAQLSLRQQSSKWTQRAKQSERREKEFMLYHPPPNLQPVKPEDLKRIMELTNKRKLKIACHVRPAKPDDLEQIMGIYNWEVEHGIQALDNNLLSLKDFQEVFKLSQTLQTPFVVVIQGSSAEAMKRKEAITQKVIPRPYQGWPTGPYSQPASGPVQETVLGFGFVSLQLPGLAGDVQNNVSGRFCGKLNIYIHNEHRRKGIGRAVLHRLAFCTSDQIESEEFYEWFDVTNSSIYGTAKLSPRKYSRTYVEVASKGQKDENIKWYTNLLSSEFRFFYIGCMDQGRKRGFGHEGIWLDNIIFQHDCNEAKNIHEIGEVLPEDEG